MFDVYYIRRKRRPSSSFCDCYSRGISSCCCGSVKGHIPSWNWSDIPTTYLVSLSKNKRDVFISGALNFERVRGDTPLIPGYCYYWEIKVISGLTAGSSVAILGVSTAEFANGQIRLAFPNSHLWGISNEGILFGSGCKTESCKEGFTNGSVIGLYLDLFAGTLEFYFNRKSMGITFNKLQKKTLYPVINTITFKPCTLCFKLLYACSFKESLFVRSLMRLNESQKSLLPPLLAKNINHFAFWDLPIPKKKKEAKKGVDAFRFLQKGRHPYTCAYSDSKLERYYYSYY